MPTTVLTYCRADRADGHFAMDAQATRLTLEAAERGYRIVERYQDEASGLTALDAREGMSAMLDDLAAGKAQGVLVTSIDRISRSLTDCMQFVALLQEMEVRLFTANQGEIDLKTYLRDGPVWLDAVGERSD